MLCKCGKKAIYFRRYSGQRLCASCFKKYFERKFFEYIRKRKIKKKELIGCAISGGKDSLVTLYLMNKLREKLKIELHAILVDEGIKNYREHGIEKAKKLCDELSIELKVYKLRDYAGFTIDEAFKADREIKPCSYCGVFRRKILNTAAKELNLSKLATGHNLDDEAQAVLMNYIKGDFERLARSSELKPGFVERIKPISSFPEKEVLIYALLRKIDFSHAQCPYADISFRSKIRDFINELEEEHAGIKFSIVRGYERVMHLFKPDVSKIRKCKVCDEPSANEICKACLLEKRVKKIKAGISA